MLSVCCVSENISQTTELWWQLRLFRLVTFCAVNKRICYAIYNMSCGVTTIMIRDKFAPSIYCMTSHLSNICQLRSMYKQKYRIMFMWERTLLQYEVCNIVQATIRINHARTGEIWVYFVLLFLLSICITVL